MSLESGVLSLESGGKSKVQSQEEFERVGGGTTQEEKLHDYFTDHPGAWLPMPRLALVITPTGIGAAVHSRVAGCRRRFGMTILQRSGKHPVTGLRISEYCYIPGPASTPHSALRTPHSEGGGTL